MPFLDQRYQLINGPRLANLAPVFVGDSTGGYIVTNENVIYILNGSGVGNKVFLPPITPQNQGRAIYVTKANDIDPNPVTVERAATTADLISQNPAAVAPLLNYNVGAGDSVLFVAQTVLGVNTWWVIGATGV
jgi:hypothetical protein